MKIAIWVGSILAILWICWKVRDWLAYEVDVHSSDADWEARDGHSRHYGGPQELRSGK